MTYRLLVVDDHTLMRESVHRAFVEAGVDVVGTAATGREALDRAGELAPDVVLSDISMPDMDGLEACSRIRDLLPNTRVVILTMHTEREMLTRAVRAGACGYLLKTCSMRELVTATRLAAEGQTVIDPHMKPHLARPAGGSSRGEIALRTANGTTHRNGNSRARTDALITPREEQVLQLITDGLSTTEVADRLFISQKTVKNHLASIYSKLGVRDRTQAVIEGVRQGIVELT